MIVMGLFTEVLNRAPGLIISNVNYVKKVVFPIEILPVIAMGATLFHSLISFGVLLTAFALFNGYLHWTVIFAPLVLLPLVILTLGIVAECWHPWAYSCATWGKPSASSPPY